MNVLQENLFKQILTWATGKDDLDSKLKCKSNLLNMLAGGQNDGDCDRAAVKALRPAKVELQKRI